MFNFSDDTPPEAFDNDTSPSISCSSGRPHRLWSLASIENVYNVCHIFYLYKMMSPDTNTASRNTSKVGIRIHAFILSESQCKVSQVCGGLQVAATTPVRGWMMPTSVGRSARVAVAGKVLQGLTRILTQYLALGNLDTI